MNKSARVHSLPITKARINLGGIIQQAFHNKNAFLLEKSGIPVAGILGIDDFQDWLDLSNPELKKPSEKTILNIKRAEQFHLKNSLTNWNKVWTHAIASLYPRSAREM